jgi:adhesin/invasin
VLTQTNVALDAIGATQVVTAIVKDQNGQAMADVPVTWSSNSAAVTVTTSAVAAALFARGDLDVLLLALAGTAGGASATLTAISNGTASITATAGTLATTFTVLVAQLPVAPVKWDGDAQSGVVGTTLVGHIQVKAQDRLGVALVGQAVTFAVTQGGGSVSPPSVISDAQGSASTSWTIGTNASVTHELTVTIPGAPNTVRFTATATPGPPAAAGVSSGNSQSATVGAAVVTPPSVFVTDVFGNAVAGVSVSFAIGTGGGSVTGALTITGATGIAAVGGWTLGTTPGAKTVIATVAGIAPVTFSATALVGPPSSVTVNGGTGQNALIGTNVATAPSVRVADQFNNAVAGASVVFVVTGGGGSATGTAATTNANGTAAVGSWTVGPTPGANTMSATVTGLTPTQFTATAFAPPANIAVFSGNGQSAIAGTAVATIPASRVTDAFSNPVSGVSVLFAVASGGGSVTVAAATTNANGIAAVGSWTLGATAGANSLTAAVTGLTPATFTATGLAGPPATVSVNGGNGQSAQAGTAVPIPPSVIARDANSNMVSGVAVTFVMTAGGGSITGASTTTNASGVATVGSWTLGTAAGANALSATVTALAPAIINATGVAGPPTSVAVNGGNGQSTVVSTPVATAPSVLVRDVNANPVAGAAVTFGVVGGGGSVTGASTATSASGVATVGSWTLGPSAGANALTATVTGAGIAGNPVAFSATGTGSAPTPANAFVNAGNGQTAAPGTTLAVPPSIKVLDAASNPVPGASVTFSVTGGGGNITGGNTLTNASGVATVGSWTLGPAADANCLTATVTGAGIGGNPVNIAATGTVAGVGYNIKVAFLTCVTALQAAAFTSAAARWGTLITGDLSDTFVGAGAGACGTNAPALNETVDDVLIFASLELIDGPNGVLGSAGPCVLRTPGNLTVVGRIRFDIADIATIQSNGTLAAVILHEMGHVLGIGTLWSTFGLLVNPSPVGGPLLDTYFSGANGIAGFNAIGGATYTGATEIAAGRPGGQKVPVENQFSAGTINAHWRESVLANELLTGFIGAGSNPLSQLTVRSLADMGYTVDAAAADPFFLAPAVRANDALSTTLISLDNDVISGPLYRLDGAGHPVRIR